MKRDEWTFKYTAAKLAEAAELRAAHRHERVEWWTEQRAKVMAEVKDSGIEVEESVAASYSNTTMKMAPQVVVRTDLQRKLNECHQKIIEHGDAERSYAGWVQVLRANPEAQLELQHDDWLYFFGE